MRHELPRERLLRCSFLILQVLTTVGLANRANPLPIVLPCHRVIGANGSLTGYGGGLPIKQRLLALERGGLF